MSRIAFLVLAITMGIGFANSPAFAESTWDYSYDSSPTNSTTYVDNYSYPTTTYYSNTAVPYYDNTYYYDSYPSSAYYYDNYRYAPGISLSFGDRDRGWYGHRDGWRGDGYRDSYRSGRDFHVNSSARFNTSHGEIRANVRHR